MQESTKWVPRSLYATPGELYRDPKLHHTKRLMYGPLLQLFDQVRAKLDHRLYITSGRRTEQAQEKLIELGYRAAKQSAHVYGVAIDVLTPAYMRDDAFADMFMETATDLNIALPRLGYKKYRAQPTGNDANSPFVHVDIMPHFLAKEGAPKGLVVPAAWRVPNLRF